MRRLEYSACELPSNAVSRRIQLVNIVIDGCSLRNNQNARKPVETADSVEIFIASAFNETQDARCNVPVYWDAKLKIELNLPGFLVGFKKTESEIEDRGQRTHTLTVHRNCRKF